MATAILTAASTSAKLLVSPQNIILILISSNSKIGEKEPSIDNWTFRLFYKCSTALLILGSFIVSSNQFFGEPIQCDLVKLLLKKITNPKQFILAWRRCE